MFQSTGLEEVEKAIMDEPERAAAIIPKMLDAGRAVMIGALQSSVAAHGVVMTGQLMNSVSEYKTVGGLRPVTIIGFNGENSGRIRNMALAAINNYGIRSGRGKREKRPFITVAQHSAEESVYNAMLAIWEADNASG